MKLQRFTAGVSLAETLVVCLLFLLAMTMIATLFSNAIRMTRAGEGRSDQSAARVKVTSQLRRAMLNSSQSGNTVFYRGNNHNDLVLSLISTLDGNGKRDWDAGTQQPVFHGYDVFYREPSDNSLRQCRVDIPQSKIAEPLPQATILSKISPQDTRILALVETFQLYSLDDGSVREAWANPLGLRLIQHTERSTPITTELSFKFTTL